MDIISILKLIGTSGAGATLPVIVMFAYFTPKDEYVRHVADSQSGFILQLVNDARSQPPGPYKDSLCRALHAEIGSLCQYAPNHSICLDRLSYIEAAGC